MNQCMTHLLTILRDKHTDRVLFRQAARTLSEVLASQTFQYLKVKEVSIETALANTVGLALKDRIVIVPILRSGISMVEPFLRFFPEALVGVVGLRRDETTARADWYYENMPTLTFDDQIIILDPMVATGGTGVQTLERLQLKGANLKKAIYVSMVCSPEGYHTLTTSFPEVTIVTAAQDGHLNEMNYIVPGLGDFGDRYFGTEK